MNRPHHCHLGHTPVLKETVFRIDTQMCAISAKLFQNLKCISRKITKLYFNYNTKSTPHLYPRLSSTHQLLILQTTD